MLHPVCSPEAGCEDGTSTSCDVCAGGPASAHLSLRLEELTAGHHHSDAWLTVRTRSHAGSYGGRSPGDGRGEPCTLDRLRQCRWHAISEVGGAPEGDRGAIGAGREPGEARPAIVDRGDAVGRFGRWRRIVLCLVDSALSGGFYLGLAAGRVGDARTAS